jgi:formylglycine-generating enzyme required for sulfatase activity
MFALLPLLTILSASIKMNALNKFAKLRRVMLALPTLLAFLQVSHAQQARFFRIAGPVPSGITSLSPNGAVTWTNAPTNAPFVFQTATSLLGPSNWVDYIQVPVSNSVTSMRLFDPNPPPGMVFIPAGQFVMGNCMDPNEGASVELPLHTNYVSAFYMDTYLVTKAFWDQVYQWATNHGYAFDNPGSGVASNHPVQTVSWYDTVKWCNARSEMEGRTAAYYTDSTLMNVYRSGQTNVQNEWVIWNAGYRLPTEAEWEKAARGGAIGHRFPWTDVDTISWDRANYYAGNPSEPYDVNPAAGVNPAFTNWSNGGIIPQTSPVGYFAPNGYGLYDMAGNDSEWCWDWANGPYLGVSETDPHGPAFGAVGARAIRGGSCGGDAFNNRTASRDGLQPTGVSGIYGFRPVLPAAQP